MFMKQSSSFLTPSKAMIENIIYEYEFSDDLSYTHRIFYILSILKEYFENDKNRSTEPQKVLSEILCKITTLLYLKRSQTRNKMTKTLYVCMIYLEVSQHISNSEWFVPVYSSKRNFLVNKLKDYRRFCI